MAEHLEVKERVNFAYSLMIVGTKRRDAVPLLQEKYNVGQKQAYNYWNSALELRDEDLEEYREKALADQISLLRNLYDKNYKNQDYKECRAIVAELSALLGTKAAQKIEQDVKQTNAPAQININVINPNETKD